jgi:hypothetical protein
MDSDEWMVTGYDQHHTIQRFILHERKREFLTVAKRAEDLRTAVWGTPSRILSVVYQESEDERANNHDDSPTQ